MELDAKKCIAKHTMTQANTYERSKHGVNYKECRECIRLARLNRHTYGYTVDDQKQISKMAVIPEDISGITACPKCEGVLKWSNDSRLEDEVYCIYCGWRPSARMAMEL